MTNDKVGGALLPQDRAMTSQANREVGARVNSLESIVTSRLRDFVRMNPPTFLVTKVGEDPQAFLDEVYKIVHAMGISSREKEELASYQLKEVAQVCYTQWKYNRSVESSPIEWDDFKEAFIGKYFPFEKKEFKIDELINLR